MCFISEMTFTAHKQINWQFVDECWDRNSCRYSYSLVVITFPFYSHVGCRVLDCSYFFSHADCLKVLGFGALRFLLVATLRVDRAIAFYLMCMSVLQCTQAEALVLYYFICSILGVHVRIINRWG